jgi:hypothetical protein
MKILRFNESHTKTVSDIEDIFYSLTDRRLELNIDDVYYTRDNEFNYRKEPNVVYKIPGYSINISCGNNIISLEDLDTITEIVNELSEIKSRLSDIGPCSIDRISFSDKQVIIKILLVDGYADEEKPNEIDGFYDFVEKVRNGYNKSYNKVTNNLDYKQIKDGFLLTPKFDDIVAKSLLNDVKRFINRVLEPKVIVAGRPYWRYEYDFKIEDNKISVIYKNRYDRYQRRYE